MRMWGFHTISAYGDLWRMGMAVTPARRFGRRGLSLIELLILVGIVAVLAVVIAPNFLQGSYRALVSRIRTDLKSITVAIESYNVAYNQYPMSLANYKKPGATVNSNLPVQPGHSSSHVNRWTFATVDARSSETHRFMTLTTPVAFMASLPLDPFADTRGTNFGYGNALDQAFILWSYGPDSDQNVDELGSQIDRLIDQMRDMSEQELMDQVHRRLTIHLCGRCYAGWIEDPAGGAP